MGTSKYLEFQRRFGKIDDEKLAIAKVEETINDDFFSWAVSHLTREKREEIISVCIDKGLPEWHIEDLKISNAKWEESKDNITKVEIDLFCKTEISHLNYVKETESKSKRFYSFFRGDFNL